MTREAAGIATVERAGPQDWQRYRALRLGALAEAPDAFASTLEEEQFFSEEIWRGRLVGEAWVTFLGRIAESDLGLVACGPYDEAAGLYSLWVAPQGRGRGLGDALVQAVIALARRQGHREILLDVGEENQPAIRLYQRNGFQPTGVVDSLPPPRAHILEHQRRLNLKRS